MNDTVLAYNLARRVTISCNYCSWTATYAGNGVGGLHRCPECDRSTKFTIYEPHEVTTEVKRAFWKTQTADMFDDLAI